MTPNHITQSLLIQMLNSSKRYVYSSIQQQCDQLPGYCDRAKLPHKVTIPEATQECHYH